MWFAAFQQPQQNPWLFEMMKRFLQGDELILGLIEQNPFEKSKPKFIKIDHYLYEFENIKSNNWWKRKFIRNLIRPISLQDFNRK